MIQPLHAAGGEANLGNGLAVQPKVKWLSAIPHQENQNCVFTQNIWTCMATAARFTVAKSGNKPGARHPVNEYTKCVHLCVEYYTALKRTDILTPATTWMDGPRGHGAQ